MEMPMKEKDMKEFDEAMLHSFASDMHETVMDQHRRLLMEFYSMGRRHERTESDSNKESEDMESARYR